LRHQRYPFFFAAVGLRDVIWDSSFSVFSRCTLPKTYLGVKSALAYMPAHAPGVKEVEVASCHGIVVLNIASGFRTLLKCKSFSSLMNRTFRIVVRVGERASAKDVGWLIAQAQRMLDAGADYVTDSANANGVCCYPDERFALPPGSLRCRQSKSHGASG
jgi:hypothetical protein